MNTEELIDTTLTTLKVIGMLPKNGRLCVRRGQLTLEPDDHLQRWKRWIYRDSRDITLMHIKNTINNATKIIKGIMSSQIEIEMKAWTLQRFLSEMTSCQSGLVNLKTTYINDTAVVAMLDVICERLQANCAELSEWEKKDLNNDIDSDDSKNQGQSHKQKAAAARRKENDANSIIKGTTL